MSGLVSQFPIEESVRFALWNVILNSTKGQIDLSDFTVVTIKFRFSDYTILYSWCLMPRQSLNS